jgi:tRNA U34 5-methylaminomethyl-2-thiouridine-forming methyltransferase MnmC
VENAFTPIETADGSSTFYSETFGEWFHNREGAAQEAQTVYVEAARLEQRVRQRSQQSFQQSSQQSSQLGSQSTLDSAGQELPPLKILDICYGLGYNTAAALETIWAVDKACRVDLRALEIDIEPARSALAQDLVQRYSQTVQQVLRELATDGKAIQNECCAQLLLGDARQQIQPLISQGWQADVIFLDPFSPPNCPQLWTEEFLGLVAQCLNPNGGVLVTYSCAAAMRATLKLAGLSIGTFRTALRKWPGTIACYSPHDSAALPPLSQQEQEHLQTRAAIAYRDPTLKSTAEEILNRRVQEQSASPLTPTKPWRRRWRQQNPPYPLLDPAVHPLSGQPLSDRPLSDPPKER